MKYLLTMALLYCSICSKAQTYTLKDIARSLKAFDTHMLYLEGSKMLQGTYDTAYVDGPYIKIALEGELWADGSQFGNLYQAISFDSRDIANNVTVVPITDSSGATHRWDVLLKTRANKNVIHFRNEQMTGDTYFIKTYQDVNTINFMFVSQDAANRFKKIATAVFR